MTAGEQSEGRGRQGRTWTAPPGRALLMSLLVRGLDERHALLPLATAVAVCEACAEVAPVEPSIKWPNDVWIERRKVAGILIEGRPQDDWYVIGIGLNVATSREELPAELRETATSLATATGGEAVAVEAVLAALLGRLDDRLRAAPDEVLSAWRERDGLRGEEVRWDGGAGTAAGIDDRGALLVETSEGSLALDAGEVHLLR